MREGRLELPRAFAHTPLKGARKPIPPLAHDYLFLLSVFIKFFNFMYLRLRNGMFLL